MMSKGVIIMSNKDPYTKEEDSRFTLRIPTVLLNIIKEEAKKRFILDHNEVPKINQEYSSEIDQYKKQIEDLKDENIRLKNRLEQLLTMVKRDDK